MMAVDQIARMMALDAAQQGGGEDVDQTYDPTSENAQSGVAVAQAIAKKPGEITTGKQYTIDGQTVTAGTGAEAFNNLTYNKASGQYSHAENTRTTASGYGSHAEGGGTTASGDNSHAEGGGTTASGDNSHAEGGGTTASGVASHAEGNFTTASGHASHAEGLGTKASSEDQHVQGKYNVEDANDTYAFIIGNGTSDIARHNAFAIDWNGLIYVNGAATGVDVSQLTPATVDQTYDATSTNAQAGVAVAEAVSGKVDKVTGKGLSTEDFTTAEKTKLSNIESWAQANVQADWNQNDSTADDFIKNKPTIPSAQVNSDWEAASGVAQILNKPTLATVATSGSYDDLSDKPTIPAAVTVDQAYDSTSANAQSGVAIEGKKPGLKTTGNEYTIGGSTVVAGPGSEVFNDYTNNKASGQYSHAEGYNVAASGQYSHVEGFSTTASGNVSHAEGNRTTASGVMSHAEGQNTTASGQTSHAEGQSTIASGSGSHAEGNGTKASSLFQHVQGRFNVEDSNNTYAFIIGNGTTNNARHNAFAVDWNGLIYVNGSATGVDVSQLTPVTVDQTYDSTSTNAQSGVAVAQAVSGKISAADYATQTTGGTVKAWTTTDGSDTILHLATQ